MASVARPLRERFGIRFALQHSHRSHLEEAPRMSRHLDQSRPSPDTPADDLDRRDFLQQATAGGLAAAGGLGLATPPAAGAGPAKPRKVTPLPVTLHVNG